ncbi:negative regulator of DNA transposition [Ophiocordyceps camponoti-floridani]|uniref:Negative regulator of DNA transposition n=1 Tax=Ophiocordyceps camponoti-floridani TaxID=2030778 RepID=A0A8H4VGH8_9HYPO|nr:negative regulator of DNA transposition [Ophiocordyceps camponoti-floridani]
MAASLDLRTISAVFESRPDIVESIRRTADSPARIALFNDIAGHVYGQLHNSSEPAQKRRRVEQPQSNGIGNAADEVLLLEVKEISVSAPQRKKLELCLTPGFLYARAPGSTVPIPGITYAWKDIEYAFYLPIPEKTQVQHNYVFFPRGSCLPSKTAQQQAEPLVFTVPSTAPKEGTVSGSDSAAAAGVSDTYKSLFHWAFARRLEAVGNPVQIVSANPGKFHSVIRQSQRPNEKAVHVNGFRGSKDGFLFFLENGILWGFKKPLIFIPLDRVAAISYTNILQITFNIVVEVFLSEGEGTEEVEFSMLDQQDYGGIDNYIKLNRLQDRSMAEQRKGKLQLAENRREAEGDEKGVDGNGMSELQRAHVEAEQQLQDDEDEEEEDYDPGSDGESEGSGESSDGEEDEDDEADEDDEEEEAEEEKVKAKVEEEKPTVKSRRKKAAEEKVRIKKEPAVKKEPRAASQMPVRRGWATVGSAKRTNDTDMGEKFDVVG